MPAWLDTLQMRPPTPAATMRVAQAFDTSQVPTRLTSSTRRNSSAGTSSSGPEPEARAAPAGHVGHQRDRPQLRARPGHGGLHRGLVGDVGLDRDRPHAERGELGGERGEVVAAGRAVEGRVGVGAGDVEAGHVGPARGQGDGGGPADAAGRAAPVTSATCPSNGRPAGSCVKLTGQT